MEDTLGCCVRYASLLVNRLVKLVGGTKLKIALDMLAVVKDTCLDGEEGLKT